MINHTGLPPESSISSGVEAALPAKMVAHAALALSAPADQAADSRLAAAEAVMRAALNDNRASDELLDQYYTDPEVAAYFWSVFQMHFNPALFQMIEPSAGTGSFYRLLPDSSRAFDVDPKYPGIETADFLAVELGGDRKIAVIGNPPFGKNSSMAIRFFNHAARQSDVIALILPRTFLKGSVLHRLNRNFHLVNEEIVPDHAFLFRGKPYNVPAVFQIWERRKERRELPRVETEHPDFEFVTPDLADFAIQRVGARAGRVHDDFARSPASHYFIRGNVEGLRATMEQLDFATVAANSAGNPSLAKSEIVALYREWAEAVPAHWRAPPRAPFANCGC